LSPERRVQSPKNCTRRGCGKSISDKIGNLKSPLLAEELAQQACNSMNFVELECTEGLLLAMMPANYSSNNTADTPGGKAFIRPAQVSKAGVVHVGAAMKATRLAAISAA
jgi:hypothetical protein